MAQSVFVTPAAVRTPDDRLPDELASSPVSPPAADSVPQDPDPDHLESLGDEIATLAAHIHAATHRLLLLIAEFDRLCGWEAGGYRSCAHWLTYRTGIDLGTAREKVRAARALVHLPQTSEAMARGQLSFSQLRALTRVATPENEGDLLELAVGSTTAQLERIVRGWKRGSREDEAAWAKACHESRTFSVFPDGEGMYLVKGRLEPEVAAALMRAVEWASDALYRREVSAIPATDSERRAAQRRADAIGLLAERAMAAGFGTEGEGKDARAGELAVPISGSRAERYQVVLHVDAEALVEAGPAGSAWDGTREGAREGAPEEPGRGRSELDDGSRVSHETSRRLCCDASVVKVTHGGKSAAAGLGAPSEGAGASPKGGPDTGSGAPVPASPLHLGRRTRTISPALRRALEARDRGCRFPGCGLRFTDAHHLRHWADGGETSLSNCLLLCRHHHRLVHEGGWSVSWWGDGRPLFCDPRGGLHAEARIPRPTLRTRPVDALIAQNRSRGADPGPWTASARWEREADIPDRVLFRATEGVM